MRRRGVSSRIVSQRAGVASSGMSSKGIAAGNIRICRVERLYRQSVAWHVARTSCANKARMRTRQQWFVGLQICRRHSVSTPAIVCHARRVRCGHDTNSGRRWREVSRDAVCSARMHVTVASHARARHAFQLILRGALRRRRSKAMLYYSISYCVRVCCCSSAANVMAWKCRRARESVGA